MNRVVFLACLLSLVACQKVKQVEVRNEAGVVIERYSRSLQDSLMQGPYEAFTEDGAIVERAEYQSGKLHGVRTLYYPNGEIQIKETHVEGKFDGPYQAFFEDGQLEVEGQYVADEAVGIWKVYYPDGTKKEEVTFANNLENGPFTEWYSNGSLKAQGTYANGDNEQGELILYDLSGDVKKRMHCEAGVCRTVWTAPTAALDEE